MDGGAPARDGFKDGVLLGVVAHAGAAAFDAEFEKNVERPAGGGKELAELIDLIGGIDETVVGEVGIVKEAGDDGHVLFADELVGHEDPAHAVLVCDEGLMRGGQGDSPRAAVELHLKKLRGHGGFSVGREADAVLGDEGAHPVAVVQEAILIEDGGGQAEVFKQEVPAALDEFSGRTSAFKRAEAFV